MIFLSIQFYGLYLTCNFSFQCLAASCVEVLPTFILNVLTAPCTKMSEELQNITWLKPESQKVHLYIWCLLYLFKKKIVICNYICVRFCFELIKIYCSILENTVYITAESWVISMEGPDGLVVVNLF